MSHCGSVCHTVAAYVTLWQRMSHCGSVCHTVAAYVTLWQRMSHCGSVCESLVAGSINPNPVCCAGAALQEHAVHSRYWYAVMLR